MENIFIVLAIIASVVYKFYENYKKEMEEAAKRQQKARRVPPTVDSDTMPPPPTPRPMSPPRPTVQLPPRPAIPVPEIRKPTPRKTVSPTPKLRTEPFIPREMTQANRLRTERRHCCRSTWPDWGSIWPQDSCHTINHPRTPLSINLFHF